ncbi:hypothetical protein [Eisenbergiella tayi]|uniref:hypothetical protein n=1 Tax=Eisenbergiella tayi TaxID=1432052 RepID=UPI0008483FC8|nr:hypothetical protein [Eisenbergiella tayi]ODR36285.1 hypothetical protein BEI60_13640 [Eisenbergiella tayi]
MGGNSEWFHGKKFGLFGHYLAAPSGDTLAHDIGVEEWNRRVDSFDVAALAKQVKETGAGYYGITIGQNSGYYCSPNSVYDEIVGIMPSKCSKRDLVKDLSQALAEYNIDLIAYLTSGAPDCDKIAMEKLEWQWGREGAAGEFNGALREERLVSFQLKWQRIIREWSLRWGDMVKGWWIDGCYFSEKMYLFEDEPNFHSFAAALRAGNPDAVLAFNTGLEEPFALVTDESDYTAGEVGFMLPLAVNGTDQKTEIRKRLGGKIPHVLSHLGESWGGGIPRMPAILAAGYIQYLNDRGGTISWDIPLAYDGTITEPWQKYLKEMGAVLKK